MSNAVAKKKYRNGVDMMNNPDLEEGYNTKRIRFMRLILPPTPADTSNIAEMEERFENYLQLCESYDMKVGNLAAYAAIGIDKATAWAWLNRESTKPELVDFIKKVQLTCAMYREGLMEDGKVNPVTGIFWQKNYDGFKDQQEVVLTPNNPLGDETNAEELKSKYLEDTYGEKKQIEQNRTIADVVEDVKTAERTEMPVNGSE